VKNEQGSRQSAAFGSEETDNSTGYDI